MTTNPCDHWKGTYCVLSTLHSSSFIPWRIHTQGYYEIHSMDVELSNLTLKLIIIHTVASKIFRFSLSWKIGNKFSVNRDWQNNRLFCNTKILYKILISFFFLQNLKNIGFMASCISSDRGQNTTTVLADPVSAPIDRLFSVFTRHKRKNIRCKLWRAAFTEAP